MLIIPSWNVELNPSLQKLTPLSELRLEPTLSVEWIHVEIHSNYGTITGSCPSSSLSNYPTSYPTS
jgi:hypothetical protein